MIHTSTGGDLPTTNSVWNGGNWPPSSSGTGFTVAGKIIEIRNHHVQEGSNRKFHRYVALVVEKTAARKRQYNKNGVELETNWSSEKLEKTGFLNIYDHKEAEDPAAVSSDELYELTKRYYDENKDELHPRQLNRFEFWGPSMEMKSKELKKGDRIQLKTKGDSIFIESCVTDSTKQVKSQSYSGEEVLDNWTHKLNDKPNANSKNAAKPIPGEELQGAADEEWD
eukprot:TRINITY_DN618_c0_g3_i1.p1 TRINITY_DN618_c0_g3~~TRINITY_DN618_c0_g3_i1.p1  ORF type:complete len:225 (-),score=94.05 TRINITY_DN618_c0_g3_i1:102-776(-)